MTIDPILLSIVVPCYNEDAVLEQFHRRAAAVLDEISRIFGISGEIIYINDGSRDRTIDILHTMALRDARITIVDLSRNFGKEIALSAGLDHVRGELAVPIDADLQDPPELIPDMIRKWKEGYDVVYARRISRQGEGWLKTVTADAFYRLMVRVGGSVVLPRDVGDFRLLSRPALDALAQFRERHRFMKGLFALVGYRQVAIDYVRDPRAGGETSWNYWKLWNFSLEGITSFTIAPLTLSTYFRLATAAASFLYGAWILVKAVAVGDPVAGFPSLFVAVTFLGGVQLTVLGIMGEYLGRIFNEAKQRPLYFVREVKLSHQKGARIAPVSRREMRTLRPPLGSEARSSRPSAEAGWQGS